MGEVSRRAHGGGGGVKPGKGLSKVMVYVCGDECHVQCVRLCLSRASNGRTYWRPDTVTVILNHCSLAVV